MPSKQETQQETQEAAANRGPVKGGGRVGAVWEVKGKVGRSFHS